MTDLLSKKVFSSRVKSQDNIYKMKHGRFVILMTILLSMVFARNILKFPISVSIILLFSCCIALLSDINELVALVASFIPLSTAFQYKYALFFCIVIAIIKYYKKMNKLFFLIPLVGMAFWEMMHGFMYDFSFIEFFRQFAEIAFVSVLLTFSVKIDAYKLIYRVFAISTIVCCSIVLFNLLMSNGFNFLAVFQGGGYRFGVGNATAENFGVNFNANQIGFICNMSMVGLLLLIRKKEHIALDYVLLGLLSVFGLMTLSRAFIICYALMFILFIFSSKTWITKIKSVFFCFLLGIVLILIINKYAPYFIENLLERFRVNDISNGRNDLGVFYNSFIFSSFANLFFGIGLQDIMQKLSGYTVSNVPHNAIQEILLVWGVIGLILFSAYILFIIKASGRKKYHLENFIHLILLLIVVQSGQLIRSGSTLLMFVVIHITLSIDFSIVRKNNESYR